MAKHKGSPAYHEANESGLQKPYYKTPGNIMTPVQGFENGLKGNMTAPSARGYNKEPGSDPFPITAGAREKSNPLSAFGLGGRD